MSTKPYNTKLSSRDSFIYAIVKLGFIKHILEENLQRDRNLEKEKNLWQKREFFSGEIFLEKILFSWIFL